MQAFILAGGKGTRLSPITKDIIPKPMAVIDGKPIIERTILNLREYGITDIYISVGHLHEKIEEHLGDGSKFGVSITYIVEKEPLGSGGALFFVKDKMVEDFVICTADAIFDIDIDRMHSYHKQNEALITLFTHPNTHPYDSDLILTDINHRVMEINSKNSTRDFFYKNNVNAGFIIASPQTLEYFTEAKPTSLEQEYVNSFIKTNRVFAYKSPEYIKDVGTPERFASGERDLKEGIVAMKNLKRKQKAIFLDRDGTINKFRGFITKAEQIELIDGVIEAIKKINQNGYLAIIITNQAVIARGECTFEGMDEIFAKIETQLGEQGAYIDGIYFCPHHPDAGFEGEVRELKIKCDCRKPDIGMIKRAEKDFNLDLSKCYMIGDTYFDVQTAINAGIYSVQVESDAPEKDKHGATPTHYAKNLLEAVDIIIKN